VPQVERDIERDYFMTAEEAKEYGIIDEVFQLRRGVSAELVAAADMAAALVT
jgi:ATP-dependent protease ClpP protease subunit